MKERNGGEGKSERENEREGRVKERKEGRVSEREMGKFCKDSRRALNALHSY